MHLPPPLALIVDDTPEILDLYSGIAHAHGLEPIAALNATDAWLAFSARPEQFRLVITDGKMPGGPDGLWLIARIRTLSRVPAVLISGEPELLLAGARLGEFRAVLGKPFDYLSLSALIAEATKLS